MLRNPNLIPLSHQHQHALALCVRIERASPIPPEKLGEWQSEIAQLFDNEIAAHFFAEEKVIFQAAAKFAELTDLIGELIGDHSDLRTMFNKAGAQRMSAGDLAAFAKRLSNHIRKEERQLFEQMQQRMSLEDLAGLGRELELAWKEVPPTPSCQISFSRGKQ